MDKKKSLRTKLDIRPKYQGHLYTLSLSFWLFNLFFGVWQSSKAASIAFFESLRGELDHDVSISIVTLGFVESELTQGKLLSENGQVIVEPNRIKVSIYSNSTLIETMLIQEHKNARGFNLGHLYLRVSKINLGKAREWIEGRYLFQGVLTNFKEI